MGIFKALAYISTGLVAATCAPEVALVAAGYVAIKKTRQARQEAYERGLAEGAKAGEAAAKRKYEKRIADVVERLAAYHDAEEKLVALYAVGLAVANADGEISEEERGSLELFVSGCLGSHLPAHLKKTIQQLYAKPPAFQRAMNIAKQAQLPRQDIDDVIMLVAEADGVIVPAEEKFIARWKKMAATMDQEEVA
jgi:tellurite resistance protein